MSLSHLERDGYIFRGEALRCGLLYHSIQRLLYIVLLYSRFIERRGVCLEICGNLLITNLIISFPNENTSVS